MQDGTPWPGNNTKDHPGMIQVFLGHSGGHDTEGNQLPPSGLCLQREKTWIYAPQESWCHECSGRIS